MRRGAALAVVLALWACRAEADAPVETARAFAVAVQRGNVAAVLPLLERSAVERLEQAAERASDQVGGRRNIDSREMLQIVDIDPTFQLAHVERLDDDAELTHVRLTGADESAHVLALVNEDGAWRVRIPLGPPPPTS